MNWKAKLQRALGVDYVMRVEWRGHKSEVVSTSPHLLEHIKNEMPNVERWIIYRRHPLLRDKMVACGIHYSCMTNAACDHDFVKVLIDHAT